MNRVPATSSNLASVGYDATTNTLEVEFRHGGIYQYYEVPSTVHLSLVSATSIGSYFAANIKKGPYLYEQVG